MLILRFLHLNMIKVESTFLSRVKGRGYFFKCRGYIVEGPYFTLKNVWKSVKRIYIKLRIAYSPLLSLLISVYSVVTQRSSAARIRKKYDYSCVARLTFLRECTHHVCTHSYRVWSDILKLAKKDALVYTLVHFSVSKHFSVCHKSFSYSSV